MAKCTICDKGVHFGNQVSHSHRRSNKIWKPNIRSIKAIIDGRNQKITICSKCLRSGKVDRAV
jgi:large subunit ribosomal protein L28